jgi:adenylate cyclase class 2
VSDPAPASTESEIKVPVPDLAPVRRRVISAGGCLRARRHRERNTLFDDAAESLAARGCALRLRETAETARLTWKGPAETRDGIKNRVEIETDVSDPGAARRILESLGYRPTFRYEKFREELALGSCVVSLDETPIGDFVEVEGPPASIPKVVAAIGLDSSSAVPLSYPALYRDARALDPRLPEDMLLPE